VEADLQIHCGTDYRDRWGGGLTLRRIAVLLRHLPPDSATHLALRGRMHWSVEAHLLDDLRMTVEAIALAQAGEKTKRPKRHDARPKPPPPRHSPERARKLADARRRARDHRRKHGKGAT
jgi:hypothetical protein